MDQDAIGTLMGAEVRSADEHRVGEVEQVFADDETGALKWVTVRAGVFGARESYIPVQNAHLEDGVLRVPFEKRVIAAAPHVGDERGHLSPAEEDNLDQYYGFRGGSESEGDFENRAGIGGSDASPAADSSTVIVSEEQLQVKKQIVQTGRLRLRKRIVTEVRTIEVSVSREELVVDDDEVFDDTSATGVAGQALSEDEFEIVLHEESVVVEKRVVPVERVRVRKRLVEGTATVSDHVRREKVDTERVGES